MATTKEREYDDRKIKLRDSEECMLSDLTKEERDIFFAGVDDGYTSGSNMAITVFLVTAAAFIVFYFILKRF